MCARGSGQNAHCHCISQRRKPLIASELATQMGVLIPLYNGMGSKDKLLTQVVTEKLATATPPVHVVTPEVRAVVSRRAWVSCRPHIVGVVAVRSRRHAPLYAVVLLSRPQDVNVLCESVCGYWSTFTPCAEPPHDAAHHW